MPTGRALGAAGCAIGTLVTILYARSQHWPVAIPLSALGATLTATLTIDALAGLYPAIRAARLNPTTALTTA